MGKDIWDNRAASQTDMRTLPGSRQSTGCSFSGNPSERVLGTSGAPDLSGSPHHSLGPGELPKTRETKQQIVCIPPQKFMQASGSCALREINVGVSTSSL